MKPSALVAMETMIFRLRAMGASGHILRPNHFHRLDISSIKVTLCTLNPQRCREKTTQVFSLILLFRLDFSKSPDCGMRAKPGLRPDTRYLPTGFQARPDS
jgi:hypothetical protein